MIFPFDRVHDGTRYRLKDLEKARIFQTICREGAVTRKEIARSLGSRPTTVSNVVHELLEDHLVSEGEVKEPGRQGRPEILLHPNFTRLVALSIYVVSREIRGALIGLDGHILASASTELPGEAGNELVVDTIVGLVESLKRQKPSDSRLLGVGLSITGSLSLTRWTWQHTARWRNIEDIDLREIARRTGLPLLPNRVLNSRLEYLLLTNPELAEGGTLLVHWGYGIGASYALEGRVIQASLGSFAEIGHWGVATVSPKPCLCGGTGCLETVAALWALSSELASNYGPIPEDETDFARFFCEHGLESDELIANARRHVAASLANLFMTLFPDQILIFGPFVASQKARDRIVQETVSRIPPYIRGSVSLRLLPGGSEGDMIGTTHRLFRDALQTLLTVGEGQERGD